MITTSRTTPVGSPRHRRTRRTEALLAALVLLAMATAQAQPAAPAPSRWEATIAKLEARDREQPPPEGPLLFTGSSTVVGWRSLASDFPFAPVLNRGFGGSQVSDLIAYADRVIIAYQPRVVVVYSGDNDLAGGKPPARVLADFAELHARIRAALPRTHLVVIGPKLSPRRWHLAEACRMVNAGLVVWAAGSQGVTAVDTAELMLGADGQPRPELYSDGLHLTPEGYRVWTEHLAPRLRELWAAATGSPASASAP